MSWFEFTFNLFKSDFICTRAIFNCHHPGHKETFEPQLTKAYFPTCAPNKDSNQTAHSRSLISLCCPHENTLHHWLFKLCPMKILIRLRAVWSKSSLGAQVHFLAFSDVATHMIYILSKIKIWLILVFDTWKIYYLALLQISSLFWLAIFLQF